MNIGAAAKVSGISAKTIRYYESIGLIPPALRAENGYRHYGEKEVETLRFIQRARRLGFSVKDVSNLLGLWDDENRLSADVKALATRHIEEVEKRIEELQTIRNTLVDLTERCQGDGSPNCPIIDDLVVGTEQKGL